MNKLFMFALVACVFTVQGGIIRTLEKYLDPTQKAAHDDICENHDEDHGALDTTDMSDEEIEAIREKRYCGCGCCGCGCCGCCCMSNATCPPCPTCAPCNYTGCGCCGCCGCGGGMGNMTGGCCGCCGGCGCGCCGCGY